MKYRMQVCLWLWLWAAIAVVGCRSGAFGASLPIPYIAPGPTSSGTVMRIAAGAGQTEVQTAIDKGKVGDTVLVSGTVTLSSPLHLRQQVRLVGASTTITGPPNDYAVYLESDNVAIESLSLKGPHGIKTIGHRENVRVRNVSFYNDADSWSSVCGNNNNGATMRHCSMQDCYVWNPGWAWSLYWWQDAPNLGVNSPASVIAAYNAGLKATYDECSIDRCDFDAPSGYKGQNEVFHCRAGTKAPAGVLSPSDGSRVWFTRNRIRHVSRCGIEDQGGGNNCVIDDNIFTDFCLSSSQSVNGGTMPISKASDSSSGDEVARNFIGGVACIDSTAVTASSLLGSFWVTGIEAAGKNTQVFDNYIAHGNQAGIVQNPYTSLFHDNRIVDCRSGVAVVSPLTPAQTNNDPNTTLTWDINRAWPCSYPSDGPTTQPATQPDTTTTTWTASGGRALQNGVIDTDTFGVASVFKYPAEGPWYQVSTVGQVWTLPGVGAHQVEDPRPTTQPSTQPATDIITSVSVKHRSGRLDVISP